MRKRLREGINLSLFVLAWAIFAARYGQPGWWHVQVRPSLLFMVLASAVVTWTVVKRDD